MMIVFAIAWYAMLLVFVRMRDPASGSLTLICSGLAQSLSLVPMSVLLLHSAGERYRGRVMGVRTLAIYGVPPGLLAAGATRAASLGRRCGATSSTGCPMSGTRQCRSPQSGWRFSST